MIDTFRNTTTAVNQSFWKKCIETSMVSHAQTFNPSIIYFQVTLLYNLMLQKLSHSIMPFKFLPSCSLRLVLLNELLNNKQRGSEQYTTNSDSYSRHWYVNHDFLRGYLSFFQTICSWKEHFFTSQKKHTWQTTTKISFLIVFTELIYSNLCSKMLHFLNRKWKSTCRDVSKKLF